MVNFRIFSRLTNIFNRLNPINSFKWENNKIGSIKPISSIELLEKTIKNFPNFEKVIMIAIYHLINTKDVDDEYLTVLTKDIRLVADLVKGESSEVLIPDIVKLEFKSDNILITCHNHFNGAIIPSFVDFKNSIYPKILFTVIVSEGRIGILINQFKNYDEEMLNFLKIDLKDYIEYIRFSFIVNRKDEIKQLDNLIFDEKLYSIKYQLLFDEFVCENNLKFVNEFNLRMEKYNLYIVYINL